MKFSFFQEKFNKIKPLFSFFQEKFNKIKPLFSFRYFDKYQWKKLFKFLSFKDKLIFVILICFFITFLFLFLVSAYYRYTIEIPASGGEYIEGVLGQPKYLNPLYVASSEIDRDISSLIFSSLIKFDKDNNLVMDLAENYEITNDNKEYIFKIKKGVKWHDGKDLTVDDILFTFDLIQNSDYQSPLRFIFQGVKVEKVDDFTVKFILSSSYAPFITNLDIGILPKHIWGNDVTVQKFFLSEFNLKPIGSGPFKFKSISKDSNGFIKNILLESFDKYYRKKPFLDNIKFVFYSNQTDIFSDLKSGHIDGMTNVTSRDLERIKNSKKININQLVTPSYLAIFFNQNQSKILADKNVRLALNLAIDKNNILKTVLNNEGLVFFDNSPFLEDFWKDYPFIKSTSSVYNYNVESAKNLLNLSGWIDKNKDGVREKTYKDEKQETRLKISITTVSNPELESLANEIKKYWQEIGVEVDLKIVDLFEFQNNVLKSRNFESLIFGELLGADPDVFSFWHSSQKRDPGLNIAMYDNPKVDKILEEARMNMNPSERLAKYKEFEQILKEDVPASFLYSPYYLFLTNKNIKNIAVKNIFNSTGRFNNILNWYKNTDRVFKKN